MSLNRLTTPVLLGISTLGIAATALEAGSGVGAAPAPLAGAGLTYLAAIGGASGVWVAIRKFAARRKSSKSDKS